MVKCLNNNQVEWAWRMLCKGHYYFQVAEALHVCERSLRRAIKERYGRTKPLKFETLEYNENWKAEEDDLK